MVYGRDGKFTTRFLQVLRARVELVARALCGSPTTLSKVPFSLVEPFGLIFPTSGLFTGGGVRSAHGNSCQMLPNLESKMPRQMRIARGWSHQIMQPPSLKRSSVRVCGWDTEPRLEVGFSKSSDRNDRKF
jgi:hypothetical protein